MAFAWTDFIRVPAPSAHGVQVYGDVEELAVSVAEYLGSGFKVGDPAVVVATPDHWTRFAARLESAGWELEALEACGLLTVLDAAATLAEFMEAETPSAPAFEHVVGGVLDAVADRFPRREIRAFGEMVDLLCEQGRLDAAVALEELWNELARTRRFSLMCGYHLDVFDRAAQRTPLPQVCRLHSHVMPAPDPQRLARAVDAALSEVLGPEQAGNVYMLVGDEARRNRVPVPQLILMWASANLPESADRILARARQHYSEPSAVAAA
jgi:hypothetical protein